MGKEPFISTTGVPFSVRRTGAGENEGAVFEACFRSGTRNSFFSRKVANAVLNLSAELIKWKAGAELYKLGFTIHRVTDWTQLVAFAREFVRKNYEN